MNPSDTLPETEPDTSEVNNNLEKCPKCKKKTMTANEELGLMGESCPCGHVDMYSR